MFDKKRGLGLGIIALALTATLAGCSTSNPLDTGDNGTEGTITIGSQGFSESEILAQV